jgi:uncharacterized protein YhfF
MAHSGEILDYWERFKQEIGVVAEFTDAFGMGDSPELRQELLDLVLEGKKRASTTLVREMEVEGWPEPREGEYNILLDGEGRPAAVIVTVSARQTRFSEVDEEHAYWEGEMERTLESYRREHTNYYKRRGEALGFEFSDDMEVILERFEVVYPKK